LYPTLLDEMIRIARAVTMGIVFLVMATFFYREFSYSRLVFVLFWLILMVSMFSMRELFKVSAGYMLRKWRQRENLLIVGKNNSIIKPILKQCPHYQVFYIPSQEQDLFEHIKKTVGEKDIRQVFLISHPNMAAKLLELYDWCENRNIDLKIVPDILQLCKGEIKIDSSLGIPVFHLRPMSFSGFNYFFKRFMDLIIAITAVSLLLPFLIVVLLLIKIDSAGPYLYRHKRVGYRGRKFDFFKFRTMVIDADFLLEKLKQMSDRKGPVFKMSNDPRVTKIGKILRKYSIDELPQLINVLRGEMSVVGPRPQVLWEAKAYDDWARRRLRVLPGMTGLWQVSGRANLSYEEMIELDIYYIENWSPGLDIKILLKTIPAIFSQQGAY
jgi:exopolysaccharide biosynthesis polyprenyl glycosylphosphotransferase